MRKRTKLTRTACALTLSTILFLPATGQTLEADDAPENITIDSMSNLYGPVEFNHEMHVDYASCQECHHHTTGEIVTDPNCARCHHSHDENELVSCSECHVTDRFSEEYLKTLEKPELYHIDIPGLKGAYHLNCISCHIITSGPTGCQECHVMTVAGEQRFDTGPYSPKPGKKHVGEHN